MAVRFPNPKAKHRKRPRRSNVGVLPAPIGGVDGRINLAANDMSTCSYAYNLVPNEYGLRLRKGYREHVIDVVDSAGLGVNTIIPFEALDSVDDKLFGVTNEGIWDVTTYNTSPTKKVAFTADTTIAAGWGTFINYTTLAGAQLIFYADSTNGLYTYTASTDTWAQTTGITGVNETDICGIVSHKLRLWLVERGTTNAWYLDPNAVTGTATKFTFGTKFKYGGSLVGLYNWTVDGGAGIDDYLVAVSTAGDVLPYQGEDPSAAATWTLRGSYYIGAQPKGYRTGVDLTGDLYFLSSFGLISMDELLSGDTPSALKAGSIGYKISKILQATMTSLYTTDGWDMQFFPSGGTLLIISPVQADGAYIQYVLNIVTGGWGFWRGVPIINAGVWKNEIYFGTVDNRIMRMDIYRDGQLITPVGAVNGEPIPFSVLHAYSDMNAAGLQKQALLIRPNFRAGLEPSFVSRVLYDYDLAEVGNSFTSIPNTNSVWDTGIWDTAIWSAGTVNSPFNRSSGANGIGRAMAVALQGEAEADTLLVSTDVTWQDGGIL